MSETAQKIETWDSPEGEAHMAEGHEPAWRAMVNDMSEDDLSGKNILDFGCNRGGFLKLLHRMKPYQSALGVDIAEESIAYANSHKENVPASYDHSRVLQDQEMKHRFDLAFSHEVIYLLPDLAAHAEEIRTVLKPGGVYYLAIGEYAENPLWDRWKEVVAEFSPVPPQTYSLQDIARTFQNKGFGVEVRKLACEGFFAYDTKDEKYLHNPMELVDFMTQYMMYFRLTAPAA